MHYLTTVKADIENNVIRFHVVADNDSKEQQQLKLDVKDTVAQYIEKKLQNCEEVQQAYDIITAELNNIADIACQKAQSEGFCHTIKSQIGNFYFPTKQYENFQLPAGNYNTLRITIGEGTGENWWCVLYPQLCFISCDSGRIKAEKIQLLKKVLSEDEYNIISNSVNKKLPVKIKFRLLELLCP